MTHICTETNHKFEPRYDEVPNEKIDNDTVFFANSKDKRELSLRRVYVKDVCIHCGKEIKR